MKIFLLTINGSFIWSPPEMAVNKSEEKEAQLKSPEQRTVEQDFRAGNYQTSGAV